jgi:hypothetical protein
LHFILLFHGLTKALLLSFAEHCGSMGIMSRARAPTAESVPVPECDDIGQKCSLGQPRKGTRDTAFGFQDRRDHCTLRLTERTNWSWRLYC